MYKAKNFDDAIAKAERLVADGGYGHTSSLYINVNETEKMDKFEATMKTCRILINTLLPRVVSVTFTTSSLLHPLLLAAVPGAVTPYPRTLVSSTF